MRPFIIDCDTGRDDALTLWMCDALKLPLTAVVSSYGNVVVDQVVQNNCNIIHTFENLRDVRLFMGVSQPERNHVFYKNEVLKRQKSVGNGLSDVQLNNANYLCDDYSVFRKWLVDYTGQNGPLDYVIIGPASNFAKLLTDPDIDIKQHIARVFMMGGKIGDLWDEMPGADFNVGADPYSVDSILKSNVPFYIIPMNVTWYIFDTLPNVRALKPKSDNAVRAKDIMVAHLKKFAHEPIFRYHDPALPFALQAKEVDFYPCKILINLDEVSADFGRLTIQNIKGSTNAFMYDPKSLEFDKLVRDIKNTLFE